MITAEKTITIEDTRAREQAIDITNSFIVQAPAGSGKTSLLTQRFLALLAYQVQTPEECLAITFTKKAAVEMQSRIVNALIAAKDNQPPTNNHELKTYKLAKKVLEKDKIYEWELISNPSRLKIQTFDALSMSIAKSAPISSGMGANPLITEEPKILYEKAVEEFFADITPQADWYKHLEVLLLHLYNDWENLKSLFIDMLAKRDQWLDIIIQIYSLSKGDSSNTLSILENGFVTEIECILYSVNNCAPDDLIELMPLSRFAAANLKELDIDSKITNLIDVDDSWPSSDITSLRLWQGIAELLLTKTGEVRKTVTKNQGFITNFNGATKDDKQELKNKKSEITYILSELTQDNYKDFVEILKQISILPKYTYDKAEFEVVLAIVNILPVVATYLKVLFKEQGKVDFIEVSSAADKALGDELDPTDLALYMGHKINHILVDEFQDTSISQFNLLKKLTTSWIDGDGRTLFIVGDPQQSIYSFRKAEVGLFLLVKSSGLGNLKPKFLLLTSNFRSSDKIVDYSNNLFGRIFPKTDNFSEGAISFSKSCASKLSSSDTYIKNINVDIGSDDYIDHTDEEKTDIYTKEQMEIEEIIKVILQERSQYPNARVAILVRSRTHLQSLISGLNSQKIPFVGTDIELLSGKAIIKDLISLTNALLHLGDRVSWLAILRSPWCGLNLEEIFFIVNINGLDNNSKNIISSNDIELIWENILKIKSHKMFKSNIKFQRFVDIIQDSIDRVRIIKLSEAIFYTWQKLSILYPNITKQDRVDAKNYFEFLSTQDCVKERFDVGFIEDKINSIYAKPSIEGENPIEIMTIHKSKGLEFDTVILPFMDKKTRPNSQELFLWQDKISPAGTEYLLISPIKSSYTKQNLKYDYIKSNLEKKLKNETLRLLYVAITRAKSRLYLSKFV